MKKVVLSILFFLFLVSCGGANEENSSNSSLGTPKKIILNSTSANTHIPTNFEIHFDNPDAVKRYKFVELSPLFAVENGFKVGEQIELNLFDDLNLVVEVERVDKDINNVISVVFKAKLFPLSRFTFVTDNNKTMATITIPEMRKTFLCLYVDGKRKHVLIEQDNNKLKIPKEANDVLFDDPVEEINPVEKESSDNFILDSNETVQINVMVVYTSAAEKWATDNGTTMNLLISHVIATGNTVLSNSKTYTNLNLVYSGEVDYEEKGDSEEDISYDLDNLRDGNVPNVHSLRDTYNADLVTMFLQVDEDWGGKARGLRDSHTDPSERQVWSLVDIESVNSTLGGSIEGFTYIHELGHLMGAGHHKEQTFQWGPQYYDYSAGWRWTSGDNRYCTVMTYRGGQYFPDGQSHVRIPYFSNPSIYSSGAAFGHIEDGDNARTIRNLRHQIACYRGCGCGNGIVDYNEECDYNASNSDCCTVQCKFQSSSFECRRVEGDCDIAEKCTGSSAVCPTDKFVSVGTVCRNSSGICEQDAECTGSNAVCPSNPFEPSTKVCRPSSDDCDKPDHCSGSSKNCPEDEVYSSTTVCRDVTDICDVPENCNGSSKSCPIDKIKPAGEICREKQGDCDLTEYCDGSSKSCSADRVASNFSECRSQKGICDRAEFCDGTSKYCPDDVFLSSLYECRPKIDKCDIAEYCDGISAYCPEDVSVKDDACETGICPDPIKVTNFPYFDTQNIKDLGNNFSSYRPNCENIRNGEKDVVYEIAFKEGKFYEITVSSDSQTSMAILESCTNPSCITDVGINESTMIFEATENETRTLIIEFKESGDMQYHLEIVETEKNEQGGCSISVFGF